MRSRNAGGGELAMGHQYMAMAPSLIPRRPVEKVKTNRRGAVQFALLLHAMAG